MEMIIFVVSAVLFAMVTGAITTFVVACLLIKKSCTWLNASYKHMEFPYEVDVMIKKKDWR